MDTRTTLALRGFVERRRWVLLSVALAIKIIDSLPTVSLSAMLGPMGTVLSVLSTVTLVVGAVWLVRKGSRRYLYAVNRRLGLAFVFVGLVPLLFFAVLVVCVGALGVVNLAGREARRAVDDLAERALLEAVRAKDAVLAGVDGDVGPRSEWIAVHGLDGRPRRVFAWLGAEPRVASDSSGSWQPEEFLGGTVSGEPPAWLRTERFAGLVAVGDTLLVLGSCSGRLPAGPAYVFVAVEPFGERVAEFVTTETGLRARLLPSVWFLGASTPDDSPQGAMTLTHVAPESVLTELRNAEARAAARVQKKTPEDSLELSLGLEYDEGFVGRSLLLNKVLEWETGRALAPRESAAELRDMPLMRLDFDAKTFLTERFLGGGAHGWMWLAIKVLGIAMFSMMIGAAAIGVHLTSSVTRAVGALHKGTRRIRDGELDHRIRVKSRDQLGALAASFNDMTSSVTQLLEEKRDRDQLEHEMEIAASVQRTMLPERFPTIPGLEGAGFSLMAKHVGGDLYDFIPVGEDRLGILIGDVSGKGVSSALVMSNVVSSVRSFASLPEPPGPAELLTRLNGVLFQTTVADCFVTVFYAEINFRTGSIRYCNAGHNWPLLFGVSGELRTSLDAGGYMLGISRQIHLVEKEVHLDVGDVLLAYSDGLIDTVNPLDEPFELEGLKRALRGQLGRTPRQIADGIGEALRAFRGDAEEIDDITMIVLKRVALPGAAERVPEEVVG